ncbi:RTA1 like protein-domain-containing protein [Mycena capillaripes]|nr:RTA1 like protein-domain-containing protein [Mycena capillaripes]
MNQLVPMISRRDAPFSEDDPRHHYGYLPTESTAIIFVALFAISTILHISQAIYWRMWWLLPTAALCGAVELLGWSGRLWSSISPLEDTPFLMQISTIIMAPTPLLAAIFTILGRIIHQLGTSYSVVTPKYYIMVFLPCDIIALIVQGVGGGMASSADDLAGSNLGARVMLGGIGFQLAVIVLFSALSVDVVRRYLHDKPVRTVTARGPLTTRLKIMISALAFCTTTLFIRSVYRVIELAGGWEGRIIHTQVYFNVLDGGMVVLAIFTLNLAHHGLLLRPVATKVQELEMDSNTDMVRTP